MASYSLKWRWLLDSIAESHKCHSMELPRAWELQTVSALREYVRQCDPKIVFLAETKMKISIIKRVKVKLHFTNGFYV